MTSPAIASLRRLDKRSVVTAAIVSIATLFVVWNLSPWLWFTDTTPTGGDLGAHVWSPAFLRDELLPNFRLTGWSTDWYAGFPAFSFYMIVPSFLIVMVNVGLDFDIGPFSFDTNFLAFVGAGLAVSEITRRLGTRVATRAITTIGVSALGVALSTRYDGRQFEAKVLGWSPLEPFIYNDTSMDLAFAVIVLPAAVGSMVWNLTRDRFARRGIITAAAVAATVLTVSIPYGVAIKLIVVAGLVTLPAAAYAAGRLGDLAFPGPALMALMTLPFLFDRSYNIYGGNIMSTMAGEFAFSGGLSIAVLSVGVAARGMKTGRHRGLGAGLIALAGLTHLFAGIFAAVCIVALFLVRPGRKEISWLAVVVPVAGLLSAFWVLPFFWNRSLLNDMGWGKERRYVAALWSRSGGFGDQSFLVNDPPLQIFVVLALVGAVICGVRRVRLGIAMTYVAMFFAAAFLLLPDARLWNVRLLPFYYLSIYLAAGIALAEISRFLADGLRTPDAIRAGSPTRAAAVPAALITMMTLLALAFPLRSVPFATSFQSESEGQVYGFSDFFGVSDLGGVGDFATSELNYGPGWLRYNFTGYEQKSGTLEYTEMVATMDRVGEEFGCGQSLWEFEGDRLGTYGTPMAPMLLPHWTDGCIGSMEGLYFEASATTPYHFLLQSELSASPSRAQRDLPYSGLDVAKGVNGLRTLGVRYYLAFSEQAVAQARNHAELTEIATSGPWVIFLLEDHDIVSGLDHLPVVLEGVDAGGEEWLVPTVGIWEAGPGTTMIAASGPDEWPRMSLDELGADNEIFREIADGDDRVAQMRQIATLTPDWLERIETDPAIVTDVERDQSSISFTVDRIGEPVLVRTSYFPNWKVDGAEGPYRVSPNLMVVVPTELDVELTYARSGIELFSTALTIGGIVALFLMARAAQSTSDIALWDWSGPAAELPDRDTVMADVRAGTMDLDAVESLHDRVSIERRAGMIQLGVSIGLSGVSLILYAILNPDPDTVIRSLVAFGPVTIGLVMVVFGALPALLRTASYRTRVIFPATMMAELIDETETPAPGPYPGL